MNALQSIIEYWNETVQGNNNKLISGNTIYRLFMTTFVVFLLSFVLTACDDRPRNNPYPAVDDGKNILYSEFSERPKHLDPVRAYVSNEFVFLAQIYEPVVQYHYLKRPYQLIPLTGTAVPRARYLDSQMKPLADDVDTKQIAYSVYDIEIQPGIRYQPHPAFARDPQGHFLYHSLTDEQLETIYTLSDFKQTDSRELVADDYVYQIKRLAHPRLHSPIYGVMADYIVGLKEYSQTLKEVYNNLRKDGQGNHTYLDLHEYDLPGVKVLDKYHFQIMIKGKYPQFNYWLAMPFFAPMPAEADRFYAQAGLIDKNITLDWYPVGTGAYMLSENNPNLRMVMERNPNFHGEKYPTEGDKGDEAAGLLKDAGKPLPFVDKVVYNLEKETIPYWNKFLQGYYDTAGISSDSFDQAVRFGGEGEATLTDEMLAKDIKLMSAVTTSIWYYGFNMQDKLVGGDSERARLLRQAIAIAIDVEEYITIFANGRGIPAQSPIPPGIFGYVEGEAGINSIVYDWVDGKPKRKSIEEARKRLAQAGYANGRDEKTGKPLLLYFDTAAPGPDAKSYLNWLRKQFLKLNIQLVIRNTDFNRFQEKVRKGTAQIFRWGWNADYPDPENFLFLLYGPNKKVDNNGENPSNYDNPAFNRLFEQMKAMDDGAERQAIIDKMLEIVRYDSPWVFDFHPKAFSLSHGWYHNAKPNLMANNTLKYKRIDPQLREQKRKAWNQAVWLPVVIVFIVLMIMIIPAIVTYIRKEHHMTGRGAGT